MPLDNETRDLAKDLIGFMKNKYGFEEMPHIKFVFDKKNAQNPLGYTGHYANETGEIVVYCEGRHPKDILRSLAHELTHHIQNFEGAFKNKDMSDTTDPNYLVKNDFLKGIEADAFERGNVTFREWEASVKEDKQMDERKLSDKEITKSHAQGKRGEIEEFEDIQIREEETQLNESIRNSNTYIPSDRALADAYQARDEKVFNGLLKKFGIKK